MTDDEVDALVDNATHAVNDLIPATLLDGVDAERRSELLVQINDALTPILRDIALLADQEGDADETAPTRPSTIAAFVTELIETHMLKCQDTALHPDDRPADVISERFGTRANIESISTVGNEIAAAVFLLLDDGTAFRFTIECVERV